MTEQGRKITLVLEADQVSELIELVGSFADEIAEADVEDYSDYEEPARRKEEDERFFRKLKQTLSTALGE